MKITTYLLLTLLLGLVACSAPADKNLLHYEQSLCRADSLAQSGTVDSARAACLLTDLRREYLQVKEHSEGKALRLMPPDATKRFFWLVFVGLMIGLNVWLSIKDIKFASERKHRRYLVDLSENEQRLRNNECERAELEECLAEMSLADDEREEVRQSLTNLMAHDNLLRSENDSLRLRLKEYEKRPVPRELELLKKRDEHIHALGEQVQTLSSALIERDEVMEHLRRQPKFLADADWEHLQQLADRVYGGFTARLSERFALLTPADLQLCLLIRLHFTNTQIATLIAVSPASVSQQKFRLKKRLMQADETLFRGGETLDAVIALC